MTYFQTICGYPAGLGNTSGGVIMMAPKGFSSTRSMWVDSSVKVETSPPLCNLVLWDKHTCCKCVIMFSAANTSIPVQQGDHSHHPECVSTDAMVKNASLWVYASVQLMKLWTEQSRWCHISVLGGCRQEKGRKKATWELISFSGAQREPVVSAEEMRSASS